MNRRIFEIVAFSLSSALCVVTVFLRFTNWGIGFTYQYLNDLIVSLSAAVVLIGLWKLSLSIRKRLVRLFALVVVSVASFPIVLFVVVMAVGALSGILRKTPEVDQIATLSAASGSFHLYYVNSGLLVSDYVILRHEWTLLPFIRAFKTVAVFDGDGVMAKLVRVSPTLGRLVVIQPENEGGETHIVDVPL